MRGHDRFRDQQRDDDDRYGLERDERADFLHELELADRIAEQGSLPPGQSALARAAARHRLGRGPTSYEQPHQPAPQQFAAGEAVSHHDLDGDVRPGPGRAHARTGRARRGRLRPARQQPGRPRPARAGGRLMAARRRELPGSFMYEPSSPPSIPPGQTIGAYRRARRRQRQGRRRWGRR